MCPADVDRVIKHDVDLLLFFFFLFGKNVKIPGRNNAHCGFKPQRAKIRIFVVAVLCA